MDNQNNMETVDGESYSKEAISRWMILALQGDEEARRQLMAASRELAIELSRDFLKMHPDEPNLRDELVEAGLEGAQRALNSIDLEKKPCVFDYLSWWISQYVRRRYRAKYPEELICAYCRSFSGEFFFKHGGHPHTDCK